MIKELNIFGDIVSTIEHVGEVSPAYVKNEISGLTPDDELIVNIDCYGGEVHAAVAISNMLNVLPSKKTFKILGICASAATMLFQANDTVQIAKGAMVMFHKPMIGLSGNSNEFTKTIEYLNKIEDQNIMKNLEARTNKSIDELRELISGEWWLSSDEAIFELGFVGLNSFAVMNKSKTKQENIYKNYIQKKKALNVDVFKQFTNFQKQLKK
jgi:ATP-dependent Clp protease, protease subunit